MEIIYSTGKKVGAASKRPTITTNEGPPDKRVTIKVFAVRQPDSTYPAVFKPYRLFVSKAGDVDVNEMYFTVNNVSDQDLNMTLVSKPFGYFDLNIPDKIPAGKTVECYLKVNPEHLAEAFEKSLTFEFDDPTRTRITIPVVRRLIGPQKQPESVTSPKDKADAAQVGDKSGH